MSAREVTDIVLKQIESGQCEMIVVNFANGDMVGHTGVFDAAVAAVEAVDVAAKTVVEAALEGGYTVEVLADHGNADKMRNPDGSPHTAHTTVLVPHAILGGGFEGDLQPGALGDVAPTILALMGLEAPSSMTGTPLVEV
jgi:2,3-bisphosphoglycerate-independent phosphoglycerate mutase